VHGALTILHSEAHAALHAGLYWTMTLVLCHRCWWQTHNRQRWDK